MTQTDSAIRVLSLAIEESPNDFTLRMERGKLYYQNGDYDKSMNDFRHANGVNPNDSESASYIEIIREILNYRYIDIYNP